MATNTNTAEKKNNNPKTEEVLEKRTIIHMEPLSFDEGVIRMKLDTTAQLEAKVNGIFRSSFSDYAGCVIRMIGAELKVALYFAYNNGSDPDADYPYTAVTLRGSAKKPTSNSLMESCNRINGNNRIVAEKRLYDLSERGMQALAPYIAPDPRKRSAKPEENIDWKSCVYETTAGVNQINQRYNTYLVVAGLDLNRIVNQMFTGKTHPKHNDPTEITIVTLRPISSPMSNYVNQVTGAYGVPQQQQVQFNALGQPVYPAMATQVQPGGFIGMEQLASINYLVGIYEVNNVEISKMYEKVGGVMMNNSLNINMT